jgi:UDP-3-O-[3-hydroxymyristoyl] glucosamine N-acyltransferase
MRLAELAAHVGGEVRGDGEREIEGVAELAGAAREHLALWDDPALRAQAAASRAGALLVGAKLAGEPEARGERGDRALVVAPDPRLAFARVLERFHPRHLPPPGVHPTAVVGEGCRIDPGAHLGPYAVIGDGTAVESGAVVEAHVAVGRGCRIGRDAWLHPHVGVYDGCEIGDRCELHSGVVIGADGFGYASHRDGHTKIPQVGRTVLEPEVEVGANSTVDRATLDETRIGAGTKIDDLVLVGHNVTTGPRCILSGQVGLAGSTRLGAGVVLGGRAGAGNHAEIGDGVQAAATSVILHPVPAGTRVGGNPAVELGLWRRQVAALRRLPEALRRLAALERRLGASGESRRPENGAGEEGSE